MDAKELRVGNLLNASLRSGKGRTINHNVTAYNIANIDSGTTGFIFHAMPITEDILVNFGFEKHNSNPFWFRKKQLCISLTGSIELISWDMQVFKVDTECKYAHHLQNLYHALTGEELMLVNKI